MSQQIYLTQNEINELFSLEDISIKKSQPIDAPSFGELICNQTSPEFQTQEYFHFDTSKTRQKEEQSTCHKTPSQLSSEYQQYVQVTKSDYEKMLNDSQKYQQIQLQLNQNRILEENNKLKVKNENLSNQVKNLQSQIFLLRECSKKQQSHIMELLDQLKKLEHENQCYSDEILQLKLVVQDQNKITQKYKIDSEQLKLDLINKNNQLKTLQYQLNEYNHKEFDRAKCTKSAQRSNQLSTTIENSQFLRSHYPSQPQISQSFSNIKVRTRTILRQNL